MAHSEWEAAAWRLHDADPSLFPLCPWCGFDAGLVRGEAVPLTTVASVAGMPAFVCPRCEKHFVQQSGGALDEMA
jgi:hypothetical protein